MVTTDPGHWYSLQNLDAEGRDDWAHNQDLVFVKRNEPPEKYPGNADAHPGTTIQEVCRALIDRCQYVNKQIWCSETDIAIRHLRAVILELETRAAKRHGRKILPMFDIENEPTCKFCGHIQCNESCRKEANGTDTGIQCDKQLQKMPEV